MIKIGLYGVEVISLISFVLFWMEGLFFDCEIYCFFIWFVVYLIVLVVYIFLFVISMILCFIVMLVLFFWFENNSYKKGEENGG